ncbi:CPBP family intramembrane glutamic endopeptidase [Halorussus lipolyticus]|uniref:CPBP family intramembrane glutamic endopeptidase n=1 Tax=Halorussus lipolyticus TaxID=3034024 RepID=UPI0023E80F98|nr:CPBP family intramembrane glutamic endopeptidase [Halorussus sp. DT80]
MTLAIFRAGIVSLGTVVPSVTESSIGLEVLTLLALSALYVVLVVVAIVVAARLERRAYTEFGLNVGRHWIRNFVAGAVFTVVGIAVSVFWGELRGLRDVDLAVGGGSGAGVPLVVGVVFVAFLQSFLLGNVYEEVVYRRIVLGNFAEGLTARGLSPTVATTVATAASLLLFGLYHVPLRGNVVVAIDAALVGITFSLAYLLTGELGLPVGIHFGRVLTELLYGRTIAGVAVPQFVELTRTTLTANLEVKLVRLSVICLFVLAWVYLARGELRLDETVYRASGVRSDAD